MASNVDIQKVILALGESKAINLDITLHDLVASRSAELIGSVANLEPWEMICYTWVTYIRRRPFNEVVLPMDHRTAGRAFDVHQELER